MKGNIFEVYRLYSEINLPAVSPQQGFKYYILKVNRLQQLLMQTQIILTSHHLSVICGILSAFGK